jgi:Tol biopolymer transport system component
MIEPVSVSGNACTGTLEGTFPDPGITDAAVSADGRYVAFTSEATALVAGDTNHEEDIFVRDRVAGTVQRVDVTSAGAQAPANSTSNQFGADDPAISADGRYVTFWSWHALAPGTTEGARYSYLRDRVNGTTEVVSILPDGSFANATDTQATVSDDGRYVAFADDRNMYVRDRVAGTSTQVNLSSTGAVVPAYPYTTNWPVMSGNGRYVTFRSTAPDVVPNDPNPCGGVFVRDVIAGTTERADVTSAGVAPLPDDSGQCSSWDVPSAITDDGRYVAFMSDAWNLYGLPSPTRGSFTGMHVYVRDRTVGTTTRVDALQANPSGVLGQFNGNASDASISDDGRYVAYRCRLCDGNTSTIVYLTDRVTGGTHRVGISPQGTIPNGEEEVTYVKDMSADGHYMTFDSSSTNLSNDANANRGWDNLYIQRVS